jgi:hypothetical protein
MLTLRVPSHHCNRCVSRCCETQQKGADQTILRECRYIQEVNKEIQELFRVVRMSESELGKDQKYKDQRQTRVRSEARNVVQEVKRNHDELHFHFVRQAFMARCICFGLDPQNLSTEAFNLGF